MATFVSVELNERTIYRLMVGSIVPRPIAWVTSESPAGLVNLAPFSFFNGVATDPPTVMISIGLRAGEKKDTLRNIESTGDFVVNMVTESLAHAMNISAADFLSHESEVPAAGVTLIEGTHVRCPRIREAPISMECRLDRILVVGRSRHSLVLGEVLAFHVEDALLRDGRIDPGRLPALGRLGGDLYCSVRTIIEMKRPHYVTKF